MAPSPKTIIEKLWQEQLYADFLDMADGLSGKWVVDSWEELIKHAMIDCRWALWGRIRDAITEEDPPA